MNHLTPSIRMPRMAATSMLAAVFLLVSANAAQAQRPGTGRGQGSPIPAVPSRAEAINELAPSFPMPVSPVQPVQPKRPSGVGPFFLGLLAGGGAYVGLATVCGQTEYEVTSPLGSMYQGKYYRAGDRIPVPANPGCHYGSAAGAWLTFFLIGRGVSGGNYRRDLARYEQEAKAYPAAKAQYDRALALRNARLDSAVTRRIAQAQQRADSVTQAIAQRDVAANPPTQPPAQPSAAPAAPAIPSPTAPKTAIRNPNAVAVVIGNSRYDRPEVPPVDFAVRDAQAMRDFLINTFGFREENIIYVPNARLSDMRRIFGDQSDYRGQLYSFMSPTEKSDVFVFYSGHGAPDLTGTSGTAYLVPSDADPQSLRFSGFPVSQLYANLAQLNANSITVVLDACFSGLTDRGALLRGISPLTLRVENPVLAAPNSVVLTASQSTEVSGWYDQQQHGLFTYVFLETVSKAFASEVPERVPTAKELHEQVRGEVVRLSRRLRQREQTPQVYGAATEVPLPFVRVPR